MTFVVNCRDRNGHFGLPRVVGGYGVANAACSLSKREIGLLWAGEYRFKAFMLKPAMILETRRYPAILICGKLRALTQPGLQAVMSARTEESVCMHEWSSTRIQMTRSSWRPKPARASFR